eukprot:SAG22_NODE_259_length_13477_cov_10.020407_2_plen_99_part_00
MSTTHVHQLKSKGISIYDVSKNRMIHYSNPYGVNAKKAYKRYLKLGYDASMILPPDLKHHPLSHTSSRDTRTKINSISPPSYRKSFHISFRNPFLLFT